MTSTPASPQGSLVDLFVTCLVDLFRPSVGFATIKLLEGAGARVEVPRAQTPSCAASMVRPASMC
jgi:L-lactate dehydrogenase complex protein LldE